MPLFYFFCEPCQKRFFKLLKGDQAKGGYECPTCSKIAARAPQAPSSQVLEVVDNGLMPRKIERYADAQRIFKERSVAADIKRSTEEGIYTMSPEDQEAIEEEKIEFALKK